MLKLQKINFKNNCFMNIKISLLSVVMLTMSVYAAAQTARNPLNHEPARVTLKKNPSSWKLTDETFYRADGTQFDKRTLVYDANGRLSGEITVSQSKSDESIQNTSKCDYFYNDNKSIAITAEKNMTGWQNISKVETISNDGKSAYSLSYSWDNTNEDWKVDPSLKCTWIYDGNGRVSEYTKQPWNKEKNDWNEPYARVLYSYDGDGDVSEEVYQQWNAGSSSWTNRGKYSYEKGDKNQKVAMSYFYASEKWTTDGKAIYSYDEDGKVARGDFYGDSNDAAQNAFCIYSYTEKSTCEVITEAEDINIYPNPAVTTFELTVPSTLIGKTANIFDVWGKQVKSVIVSNEKMQVDVSGLTEGVYVLHVGEKTKKLIVK